MVRSKLLRRCVPTIAGLAVLALVVPAAPAWARTASTPWAPRAGAIQVIDISNPRPQLASGGEVLVEVKAPPGRYGSVQVLADGRDVTPVFARQLDGSLLGLVTGLRLGANTIVARLAGGHSRAKPGLLRVVNHPITGPVFSGPQQTPFICQTQAFGLPPAEPPLCSAPTQVSYLYVNTAGQFLPLANPASRPADLASATVNGKRVPYIVRLEQGTIDRGVYQIAALYDGLAPNPLWI